MIGHPFSALSDPTQQARLRPNEYTFSPVVRQTGMTEVEVGPENGGRCPAVGLENGPVAQADAVADAGAADPPAPVG